MTTGIALFEWRYATRRLTFAAAAALFALFGFALASTGYGAADIPVNAPYAIASSVGLLSLLSVFALTVIVAPALLRDAEHQMAEIVYATAVSKGQYLVGRLAGSLLAALAAAAFGVLGMIAGTLRHDPGRVAPLQVAEYAWACAVLLAPSMFFVAALLFTVAALTRRTLATYVAGVCVYVAYLACAIVTSSPLLATSGPVSPDDMALAAVLDPFGLSAFFEQTHYWTPAERATRRLALEGRLLLNRCLWTAAGVVLVALAHRFFAFRVAIPARRQAAEEIPVATASASYRPVTPSGTAWGRTLASSVRLECRVLLRSWPLAALLILWAGTAVIEVEENLRSTEFGTALWPTAGRLVETFAQPLLLFGLLVLVYYAAEVVWRERTARVAEVVDATQASSALFLLTKVGALAVLVGVLLVVPLAVGVSAQLVLGQRPLELAVHASQAWYGGWPLLLFAVLAVLLQTLAPNRHAGMLLSLAAAVFLFLGAPGGPQHPLLRYAAIGAPAWSDMNGYGPAARVFHVFMAYWTLFAVLLALLSWGAWRRGTDTGLVRRLRGVPRTIGARGRLAAVATALGVAALGAFLFHQTNVANAWETADERLAWKADYEKAWGHLRGAAQPRITHLGAEIDLFPSERRYRVRGRYRLENTTSAHVGRVWVAARRDQHVASLTLDGRPATQADARFGMSGFEVSLEPGAGAEVAFELVADRSSLTPAQRHDIPENGSFFFGPLVFPTVGYRSSYEVEDPAERRRHGLPERREHPPAEPELITFDVVVSTPADQTAIASGVWRGTTERDGRQYSRFSVDHPVQPVVAVAAARYTTRRVRQGEVDVEVLHHPGHERNVPRMLEAAAQSLGTFTRRFGPYPYSQLRIVEIPAHHRQFAGFAVPGVVYLTEDRGFLTDLRDEGRLDIVTKRTAHEVAHQWWGHQVTPPDGPGASAVVETLARHSELVVLRERDGPGAVTAALHVELDRYLSGRAREPEVPLDEVEDQEWLYYAKGALVMTTLQDLLGDAALDRALRALVQQAHAGGPAPTVGDLVRHLRDVTPREHHALLEELWSETVVYDLRVASARSSRLPDGRYLVTVGLEAGRTMARDGRDEPLALDEVLEVAVFDAYPQPFATPLHVARQVVRGTTELKMVVDVEPAYVAVDPRVLRIDRNPADNVRKIEPAAEAATGGT